jgi:DNA-binding protein H-NS
MAKKAKRRGRPPGAKSPDKMDIGQLSELGDYASAKVARVGRALGASGRKKKGTRRKALPKYRSRKDPKVVWSGRGVTPVWMRDEMKGTKLKKDDFLIK